MIRSVVERREQLRAWARHDADTYTAFMETVRHVTGSPVKKLRALDLGCGSNAPMTLLLHAGGCRVTGVDARLGHRWGLGFRPRRYAQYLREAGAAKTLRKAAGELVFDRVYYRTLAEATGLRLSEEGLDLRPMDVQNPTLPVGEFDVVHSNATWEHIPDVPAANRTLAHSLKPGGIAYIEIHLFPSLSGGHDLPWIVPGRTVMGDVRPWGHLRDPDWKQPVYINRLRERDYRKAFEETEGLRIVDWKTEYTEGHELLTDAIRRELPDFDDSELTKRSIIVVVQKAHDVRG